MDKSRFQEAIVRAQNLLIVLPQNPSFDQVAGGLALYLALTNYGKKMSIFSPSPMLVEFNRLVGIDRVTQELGDKNLTVTLQDYPAQNIERVSYNIDGGLMQLTIIPKPQVAAPSPSQIVSSYGGMNADAAVLIGVQNQEELGEGMHQELAKVAQQILISQEFAASVTPRRSGVLELVNAGTSCISELVGWLLVESNLPVDQDVAGNLILGITAATNNFTSNRVRPETFELAAKLMRVRGAAGSTQQAAASEPVAEEKPPQDWLAPKIYKGTTLP